LVEPELRARPRLRNLRRRNPLALKLLDTALLAGEELLYCDSDVLFFRPFVDLFQLRVPSAAAVFMTDRQNAYSLRSWQLVRYPRRLRLVRQLNSGVVRFPGAALDLDLLEWLVAHFALAPEWMEQTGWALLASRMSCRLLDARQLTIPEPGQPLPDGCVGAHFVSSVRGELNRWARCRAQAQESMVELRSVPARRCRAIDLALSEARRVLRRAVNA